MKDEESVYRFGVFELHTGSGELERQGRRVRLQEQPLRILKRLLRSPGEIVTREALQRELWPDDTFVDFDLGINKAVRKLRAALGDSADNPRFIETLPKRGYRFIAPVEVDAPSTDVEVTKSEPPPSRGGGRSIVAAALLAIVVLATVRVATRPSAERLSGEATRLAVLPFRHLGPESDDQYFTDGLTEEVTTQLGRLRTNELRVIAPSSVEPYRDPSKPIQEIGEELGVDFVLLGSVRRRADRLRVTARLVRSRDALPLWSESFDDEVGNVFEIQGAVARGVTEAFSLSLRAPAASAPPPSMAAYDAYLRGLYAQRPFTVSALREAAEAFELAVALEPSFAPAHAALSQAYWVLGQPLLGMPYRAAMERAKEEAREAIALDETLDAGHSAIGWVELWYDWDWASAEASFRRALALNPSSIQARLGLAFLFSATERHGEAIVEGARLVELAPLDLGVRTATAELYLHDDRYEEARLECERALAIDAGFQRAHLVLQWVAEAEGDFAAAATEHERFLLAGGDSAETARKVREAVHDGGALGYWRWLRGEAEASYREERLHATIWSTILARLGETDLAFETLEEAFRSRSGDLILLRVGSWYDPLRGDPRFAGLVRRMAFPP